MGPIRYGGYRPPRESFVRLKVGGEDEDGEGGDDGDDVDDGDDGDDGDGDDGIDYAFEMVINYTNLLSPKKT